MGSCCSEQHLPWAWQFRPNGLSVMVARAFACTASNSQNQDLWACTSGFDVLINQSRWPSFPGSNRSFPEKISTTVITINIIIIIIIIVIIIIQPLLGVWDVETDKLQCQGCCMEENGAVTVRGSKWQIWDFPKCWDPCSKYIWEPKFSQKKKMWMGFLLYWRRQSKFPRRLPFCLNQLRWPSLSMHWSLLPILTWEASITPSIWVW